MKLARRHLSLSNRHLRPVLIAVAAGVIYGCWAACAHYRLGFDVALRAGETQAALSLSASLVLAIVLERLFCWPSNPVHGFWLAAFGTSMLTASWLIIGHLVAGTSDIAMTIAPSLIVGVTTSFVYSRMLFAQARREPQGVSDKVARRVGKSRPSVLSAGSIEH